MRIGKTVVLEVVGEALVLLFSCGFVPLWIVREMLGLLAGGPVA